MILALAVAEKNSNIVTDRVHNMKQIRKGFILILGLGAYVTAYAQQPGTDSLTKGNALIYKDPRIDYLQKVYSAKNKVKSEVKKVYRVQIAASKSRTEVNDIKSQFSAKYPGIPVFMSFDPPTFKLRVGNFIARQDAQTFLNELRRYFPASFIVE